MNAAEQKLLLTLARDTLRLHLSGQPAPVPKAYGLTPALEQPAGVFVTLKMKQNHELRGCIGYMVGVTPLAEAVADSTMQAATRDRRFRPMRPEEEKAVFIEISVLSPPKRVLKINEIEIGRHGLIITRGSRSGLLLPQVPVELKWGREEFLSAVCRKAELPDRAWEQGAELYTFSAQVFREQTKH